MNTKLNTDRPSIIRSLWTMLLLSATVAFPILVSGRLSPYFYRGMLYSAGVLLPSTLPFMIVSEAYSVYGHPERIEWLCKPFSLITGFCGECFGPFAVGCVAGFPIGAKMSAETYARGLVSKGEAERLSALSNQPSPAFVFGVLGAAVNIPQAGVKLYSAIVASSLITALITRKRGDNTSSRPEGLEERAFDLVGTVRGCAISSVYLCAFVSLFYALTHLLEDQLPREACYFIYPFFEVCSGCQFFAGASDPLSLAMLGFTLGFGGLSVGMQSALFLRDKGLSLYGYFKYKLIQGTICFVICLLLSQTV